MEFTTENVVLFAFRDATRVAQVLAVAGGQTGVRSVAIIGRSTDCEIRIIGRVGEELTDARWLASTLAVLDVLSGPLRVLAGVPHEAEAVMLPDSDNGFATFGRLIPHGALVILVMVCDDSPPAIGSFESQIGAAVFGMTADWAMGVSVHSKVPLGTGSLRTQ
jgi:hypothetical protein